jgi:hypothetical protein
MTTMTEVEVRCALCGTLARMAVLSSTSSFGPPDLDLRPQGPARWALEFEVQRCDACGYCAESIGQAPLGARETVESTVYREVLERSRLPRLARSLFCAALVSEGAGKPEQAGWRFLQAAWACDDRNAVAQAATCRARSAEMFARALETGEVGAPESVVLTLSADVWRRAGRFEEAIAAAAEAERLLAEDEADEDAPGAAEVAAFIRGLAEEGDSDLHNAAEVFADES